ncbi:protein mono-ADP-ribosyltransferase PARP14-like [Heptranchias perlo]|uniref:protein mono-ADP-ribosyltransferase PARP14-like n=1 Tax=Heptranchias perlo TaxID=212740 RepID=UPI00355A2428
MRRGLNQRRTPLHIRWIPQTYSCGLRARARAACRALSSADILNVLREGISRLLWIYAALSRTAMYLLGYCRLRTKGSAVSQLGSSLDEGRPESTMGGTMLLVDPRPQGEDTTVGDLLVQGPREDDEACVVRVSMTHFSWLMDMAGSGAGFQEFEGQELVHYETHPSMMASLLDAPPGAARVRRESGGRSVSVSGAAGDVVEALVAAARASLERGPGELFRERPGAAPFLRAHRIYRRLFEGEVAGEFPSVEASPPDSRCLLAFRGPRGRVREAHRRVHGLVSRLGERRPGFSEGEARFLAGRGAGELEALILRGSGVRAAVEGAAVWGLESDDLEGAAGALRGAVSSRVFEAGEAGGTLEDLRILGHLVRERLKGKGAWVEVQGTGRGRARLLVAGYGDQVRHLGRGVERCVRALGHAREDMELAGSQLEALRRAREALVLAGLGVGVELRPGGAAGPAAAVLRGREGEVSRARRALGRLLGSWAAAAAGGGPGRRSPRRPGPGLRRAPLHLRPGGHDTRSRPREEGEEPPGDVGRRAPKGEEPPGLGCRRRSARSRRDVGRRVQKGEESSSGCWSARSCCDVSRREEKWEESSAWSARSPCDVNRREEKGEESAAWSARSRCDVNRREEKGEESSAWSARSRCDVNRREEKGEESAAWSARSPCDVSRRVEKGEESSGRWSARSRCDVTRHVPELSREPQKAAEAAAVEASAFGQRVLASLQRAEAGGFATAALRCSSSPGWAGLAADSVVEAVRASGLAGGQGAVKHIVVALLGAEAQAQVALYQAACVRQWSPARFTLRLAPRPLPFSSPTAGALVRGADVEFTSEFIEDVKTDVIVSPIILGKGLSSTASSRALLHKGREALESLFEFVAKDRTFCSGEMVVVPSKYHTDLEHEFVYFTMWEERAVSKEQKIKTLRSLLWRSLEMCHGAALTSIAFPVSDLCRLGFTRTEVVETAVEEISRFEDQRPWSWIKTMRLVLQVPHSSSHAVLRETFEHFLRQSILCLPEDPFFIKYLEDHGEAHSQLRAELLKSDCHLGICSGSGQVYLLPTSTKSFGSWKARAEQAFGALRAKYRVSQEEEGPWLREVVPDSVALYRWRGGRGQVAVGPAHQVERAAREMATLALDRRATRRTRELPSLAKYLVVRGLFEEQVREACSGVRVELDPSRPALTLSGPHREVCQAEEALHCCTDRLLARPLVHLSQPESAFLGTLDPQGFALQHFFARGVAVALETGGRAGASVVTLHGLHGDQLSEAESILCRLVSLEALEVPGSTRRHLTEAEWGGMVASHRAPGRVSVETASHGGVTRLTLAGFREEVQEAARSIGRFLAEHAQAEETLPLPRPELARSFDRFLEVMGLRDLGRYIEVLHQWPTPVVALRGRRKEVDKAKEALVARLNSLVSQTFLLREPGGAEYMGSGQGQEQVEVVGRACECLIVRWEEEEERMGHARAMMEVRCHFLLPGGVQLLVVKGDVTAQDVDMIVDVADRWLENDGSDFVRTHGKMETAAVPEWSWGESGRVAEGLKSAVASSLEQAESRGARSIALICPGLRRRVPVALAAGCVISAVRAFCQELGLGPRASLSRILLVDAREPVVRAFQRASSEAWIIDAGLSPPPMETEIAMGCIEDEMTDVVVSPVTSDLNLESSAISAAILRRAKEDSGTTLAAPARSLRPGEVVQMQTSRCRTLNFAFVYYIYCINWSDQGHAEQVTVSVAKCKPLRNGCNVASVLKHGLCMVDVVACRGCNASILIPESEDGEFKSPLQRLEHCDNTVLHGECDNTVLHGECDHAALHGECDHAALHGDSDHAALHGECDHAALHGDSDHAALHGECDNTVLHGECDNTLLRSNVRKCLETCHDSDLAFITFPLLGTGALGFPRTVAIRALLEEIFRFAHDRRVTSVKVVRVLVHPDDSSSLPVGELLVFPTPPLDSAFSLSLWPVVLEIIGKTSQHVQAAFRRLERLFTDNFSAEVIRDKGIGDLTCAEVSLVQRLSRKSLVHVGIKRGSENQIALRGPTEGVRVVSSLVQKLLTSRLESSLVGRLHNLMASVVQWHLAEYGSFVPFDKESNYRIEEDYSAKRANTVVSVRGRRYQLHLDRKEGEELDTRRRVRLKRFELFTDNNLPLYWDDMNGIIFLTVELQQNSPEYGTVSSQFQRTISNSTIVKIVRIQNIYLRLAFETKKRAIEAKNGLGESNEKLLFHGTKAENCDSINKRGFNRSFAGQNGTSFGQGVYFAVKASQSSSYSPLDGNNQRHMYLSRVLTGRCVQGSTEFKSPPTVPRSNDLYDSTVDSPVRPKIFVVFHDNQAYAEYLITFR